MDICNLSPTEIIFNCPHCDLYILVLKNEINCQIFRHAYFKDTFEQINPHASKEECERLILEEKIIGCGKPFKLSLINDLKAEICDYI